MVKWALDESRLEPTWEVLQEYERAREVTRWLTVRLVEAVPHRVHVGVGERLGLRGRDGLVRLPSERVAEVFMEACIHGWPVDGQTVVQAFARRQAATGKPRLGAYERRLLEAKAEAHYSFFQVEEAVPGMGLRAKDGRTGKVFFLMDRGLGLQPDAAGLWYGSRLMTVGPWKMTTGACLPLGHASDLRVEELSREAFAIDDPNASEHEGAMQCTVVCLQRLAARATSGRAVATSDPISAVTLLAPADPERR